MICEQCKAEFRRRDRGNRPRYDHAFCSQVCYTQWKIGRIRKDRGRMTVERGCPTCGQLFLAGGRGNASKHAVFCSRDCADKARYRHSRIGSSLTNAQAAYLAGLIDGKGSIIHYLRSDAVALRLTISHTSRRLLEWVASTTGIGSIVRSEKRNPKHKAGFWWQVNADAAESILRQIRPYLVLNREQADLAIESHENLRDPALKVDRSWHTEAVSWMRQLNQRGNL